MVMPADSMSLRPSTNCAIASISMPEPSPPLLKRMERAGLVTRSRHGEDERRVVKRRPQVVAIDTLANPAKR